MRFSAVIITRSFGFFTHLGLRYYRAIFFLLLAGLMGSPSIVVGQQESNTDHYGKIGIGFGLHTAGYFQGYSYAGKKRPGPTYSLTGDIKLGRVISLGMLLAYSHGTLEIEDATRRGYPGDLKEELVITGRRFFISQRTLFYYFDRPDLALYSGFGIGFAQIMRETDTGWYQYTAPKSDPLGVINIFDINRNVSRFNFQLVLLGLNTEVSKNAGLNFELGIGPPYYFNLNFYLKLAEDSSFKSS